MRRLSLLMCRSDRIYFPELRLSQICWNSVVEGIAIAPITQFALSEY